MIKVENLSISFAKELFDNVSFQASKGEIISIDGESGSGKTTLLKYLIGKVNVSSGKLSIDGKELDETNRNEFLFSHVSYVSQMGDFYPNMSIKQHFDFYSHLYHIEINDDIIHKTLKLVNLENINIKKSPIKLSVGERKRFLIALTIFIKKDIIILDEPTASIDYKSKDILFDVIKKLSDEGVTFIIATHDQSVIDMSHRVYMIKNCKLIETKKCKKEDSLLDEKRSISKLKYRKYKNIKLRTLFIIILLFGCICISFVSQTIALTVTLNESQTVKAKSYKNDKLYLFKRSDPKNPLDFLNLIDDGGLGNVVDFISQEEIEQIKGMNGVKDVLPCIMTDTSRLDALIDIYKDGNKINQVDTKVCLPGVRTCPNSYIIITGYYPEENIQKDGKKIDGIYINDEMDEILDLDDYNGISIKYNARFPSYFLYNKEDKGLNMQCEIDEVTVPIDGVLSLSDYFDGRLQTYARIYMPVQQLETLMKKYYNDTDKNEEMEYRAYQPRQYMIICEEGKDEELKIQLEKDNPLYKVVSQQLTEKEYLSYLQKQTNSSFLLTSLSSVALLLGVAGVIVYYIHIRKNEMELLKNDGLKKYIKKYFREDSYIMMLTWTIVSTIVLALYYIMMLPVYGNQISKTLFIAVWIITTFIIVLLLYWVKEFNTKKYIERVD
ncbi:MAG: ABC transporter ATP-binding protein [Coprobacillus sp.]